MSTITNNNGIRFKICCASCENRVLDVSGSYCGIGRAKKKQNVACNSYKFRQSLMDAGKKKGRIKKSDYFRFYSEWRQREKEMHVPKEKLASIYLIRAEYEKLYDSIYLTN